MNHLMIWVVCMSLCATAQHTLAQQGAPKALDSEVQTRGAAKGTKRPQLTNGPKPATAPRLLANPRIPQAVRDRMSARMDGLIEARDKRERSADEAQLRRLELATKPFTDKFQQTVKADRALQRKVKTLQRELEGLNKDSRLSESARAERMKRLSAKHKATFDEVLAKSGVNITALRNVTGDALGVPQRARVGSRSLRSTTFSFPSYYTYVPPPPSEVEIRLTPPYEDVHVITAKKGLGSASVDSSTHQLVASTILPYVGFYTNEAGIGVFSEVPAGGYETVTVDLTINNVRASSFGFSIVGWVNSKVRTRIDVLSQNEVVCSESVTHLNDWAIVGAYDTEVEEPMTLQCSFAAPPAGTPILSRFTARGTSNVVSLGGANSFNRFRPSEIRIRYQK